jgi:hypothetical protein
MKCIQCGTDNTLKDRTGNNGRCKNCQHPFVFEPTTMGTRKVTDPLFAKAIADLSANGTLFFTRKQFLYYLENRLRTRGTLSVGFILFLLIFFNIWATGFIGGILSTVLGGPVWPFWLVPILVNGIFILILYRVSESSQGTYRSRKRAVRSLQVVGGILFIVGIICLVMFDLFLPFVAAVTLGIGAIYLGILQQFKQSEIAQTFVIQSDFPGWVTKWQQVNGSIEKMLPLPREESTPVVIDSDATAYSFDRLVVCDSAPVAQMLIANNFHFENNCAILSITGYPQSIFSTAMEMLRRNPELQVYALHDCSPRGLELLHHLRSSPQWFPDSTIAIIDVGLSPRQVMAVPGMFVQTSADSAAAARQMPAEVRYALSASEIIWLEAGNFVELESFTPKRLIQILNRGIAGSRDLGRDPEGTFLLVGESGGYYMTESFG